MKKILKRWAGLLSFPAVVRSVAAWTLIVFTLTLPLTSSTLAKYVATGTGTGRARIARFDPKVDAGGATELTNRSKTFFFKDNSNANLNSGNVLCYDNSDSEVSVNFTAHPFFQTHWAAPRYDYLGYVPGPSYTMLPLTAKSAASTSQITWQRNYPFVDPAYVNRAGSHYFWAQDFNSIAVGTSLNYTGSYSQLYTDGWLPGPVLTAAGMDPGDCYLGEQAAGWGIGTERCLEFGNSGKTNGQHWLLFENPVGWAGYRPYAIEFDFILNGNSAWLGFIPYYANSTDFYILWTDRNANNNSGIQLYRGTGINATGQYTAATTFAPRVGPPKSPDTPNWLHARIEFTGGTLTYFLDGKEVLFAPIFPNRWDAPYIGFMSYYAYVAIDNLKLYFLYESGAEVATLQATGYYRRVTDFYWRAEQVD